MKTQVLEGLKSRIGPNAFGGHNQALKRAYTKFKNEHPDWTASLFDWHFITHRAAPILDAVSEEHPGEIAPRLVEAWVNQLKGYQGDSKRQLMTEAEPAVREFLELLQFELACRDLVAESSPVGAGLPSWTGR